MDPARSEKTDQNESPGERPAPESGSVESAIKEVSALLRLGEQTSLVAVPIDPYVVHCQWEVAPADIEAAKKALGVGENEYWPVLQFYDVTNAAQAEAGERPTLSVPVQLQAENWYVRSCSPDHAYRADLALKGEEGSLAVLVRSQRVQTPPSAPSTDADTHWLPIRPGPQIPEIAPAGPSPEDLELKPPSSASEESVEPTAQLPIDMSEEVWSKMAALYGEPTAMAPRLQSLPHPSESRALKAAERASDGPLAPQTHPQANIPTLLSPLPIDMHHEMAQLYRELYNGWEQELAVLSQGSGFSPAELRFDEEFSSPGVLRPVEGISREILRNHLADLTELDDRKYVSGISSPTK